MASHSPKVKSETFTLTYKTLPTRSDPSLPPLTQFQSHCSPLYFSHMIHMVLPQGSLHSMFPQPGILFSRMAVSRSEAGKCKVSIRTSHYTRKIENAQGQTRSCQKDAGAGLKGLLLAQSGTVIASKI